MNPNNARPALTEDVAWLRSDLTAYGLGRGLVVPTPRVALTFWRSLGTFAVTGPDGRTVTGLSRDGVRVWCDAAGVSRPPDEDVAWLLDGGEVRW